MSTKQKNKIFLQTLIFYFLIFTLNSYAADLVVNGTTVTLGGYQIYDNIRVINGGKILVTPFNGSDRINTGNLVLKADSIFVDETSTISAKGSGYQTVRCGNGQGPDSSGGIGGCAVRDSGGGGGHFGRGGRGTKDCFVVAPADSCQFPQEWEEDCGNSLNAGGTACTVTNNCWNFDALPTVAGGAFWHTIYDIEFGASGGDKGCRDGDGFGTQPNVAGFGGGRIVLVAVNDAGTGSIEIRGTVEADGKRGCGTGNDSAGGGAGGTVVIIGNNVTIRENAKVSSAGGLGGDTQGLAGSPDCPPPAQQGGTCDDCGGGGGGGLVSILGDSISISPTAYFSVDGAPGGTCTICRGEAGGGAGELQLYGSYRGEVCDGYDNDFDGLIDEDQPVLSCGIPSCSGGVPQKCPPDPSCIGPVTDTRPRFLIILDTSASMLTDLGGTPTFGDGSQGHVGIDSNLDGVEGNDSKLFLAKESIKSIISAYPEIDWALARYHQDSALNQSCQLAHWVECKGMCCGYDDPRNNQPPPASPVCTLYAGASGSVQVNMLSPSGEQCINYAGSCGIPRKGADIIVGFGARTGQYLMWMNHRETSFNPDDTEGDYCNFRGGGDCELRGTGPTPLAGSINAAEDYLSHVIACDGGIACRKYGVILLTDGAESCGGDPVTAAQEFYTHLGVPLYVIGFSVLPEEVNQLNAIARAGSGGAVDAFLVGDEVELTNTLAGIVSTSFIPEVCNSDDDDCDGLIDEDFPDLGNVCNDGRFGICRGYGVVVCSADGNSTECVITSPGSSPQEEICNGVDDDCDGLVDEDLVCQPQCEPSEEVCDGVDNDCDGAIDEEDPAVGSSCGQTDAGPCELGTIVCIGGRLMCIGEVPPRNEICNCEDDDCNGEVDNDAPCPGNMKCIDCACRQTCIPDQEFNCPAGYACTETEDGYFCLPTPCLYCEPGEVCIDNQCVDLCEGVECAPNEQCLAGHCYDCYSIGCPRGKVCVEGECREPPCEGITCDEGFTCIMGECVKNCDEENCPEGTMCGKDGECLPGPCAEVNCSGNTVCINGNCVSNPCDEVTCPAGKVCVEGVCVWNRCDGVECPEGYNCIVFSDGSAVCVKGSHRPTPSQDAGEDEGEGGGGGAIAVTGAGGCGACNLVAEENDKQGTPWQLFLVFILALIIPFRSMTSFRWLSGVEDRFRSMIVAGIFPQIRNLMCKKGMKTPLISGNILKAGKNEEGKHERN